MRSKNLRDVRLKRKNYAETELASYVALLLRDNPADMHIGARTWITYWQNELDEVNAQLGEQHGENEDR